MKMNRVIGDALVTEKKETLRMIFFELEDKRAYDASRSREVSSLPF